MSSPYHSPPAAAAAASPSPVRRSFTLPARTTAKPRAAPPAANSADGIETLFVCSSTKTVSFTATAFARHSSPARRHSAGPDQPAAETIPWHSVTERTLAVGALRIYRVTASNVSFLNSGTLLHTIFPKSQCWCVDGDSKFVLRVRQDSYYRIELPYESEEDKVKIGEFKSVLGQVLQYERTQCPFTRAFHVELPEQPKTPPRRRPKKPPEKAKKWLFDKAWVPENGSRPSTPTLEGSDSGTMSSYDEDDRSSVCTDRSEAVSESLVTVLDTTPPRPQRIPSVSERAKIFQGVRSVTTPSAPSSYSSGSSAEPIPETQEMQEQQIEESQLVEKGNSSLDPSSLMSSTDSFYSLETANTTQSPSPPFVDAEDVHTNPWATQCITQMEEEVRGRGRHRRHTSEATLKAAPSEAGEDITPVTPTIEFHPATAPDTLTRPASSPSTPPLVSDSDEDSVGTASLDVRTPPDAIRMKKLRAASQQRAYSPMPQSQNLFCPPQQGPTKQFTNALIRKTCEIVLGPPAHLVSLMLRIAANISNGFGFNSYRVSDTVQKLPCSWESDEEDEWAEDDFGIPLNNLENSTLRRRGFSGDVD